MKTQNQHTPDPWILRGEGWIESAVTKALVCQINLHHADGCGAANAQLIANAPEMQAEIDRLKAINAELAEMLKFVIADQNSKLDYECAELLRAALAKAQS